MVQVYSTSFVHATEAMNDGLYLVRRQLVYTIIGAVLMMAIGLSEWRVVKVLGVAAWLVAFAGVLLTLNSSFAIKAGGASRWVALPFGMRFEPSELLKISYPFLLAWAVTGKISKTHYLAKMSIVFYFYTADVFAHSTAGLWKHSNYCRNDLVSVVRIWTAHEMARWVSGNQQSGDVGFSIELRL
ncbi:MAG: FtsW/RodA/SpoVE family cell cycle protein [Bdellovibrionales bacterium]